MRTLFKGILYFVLIVFILSCRKDEIHRTTEADLLPTTENVKFHFLITQESGQPIPNAEISINADVYTTDQNGIAATSAYEVPSLGLLTRINADGFEEMVKLIDGPDNSSHWENITLVKSTSKMISTGETGSLEGGGSLTLPPSLIRSDGTSYTGAVEVVHTYLDPDDEHFLASTPGNLIALNADNEYQLLASLGMYMIELYDQAGRQLNIPDGSMATIQFPIASSHQDMDHSTIPLWYFDEENGLWIEDGEAKVEGNMMVAKVSHFTWWNCDLPYDFKEIYLTFYDSEGDTLPALNVAFSIDGVGFGTATTDILGRIAAKLPLGHEVNLVYHLGGMETGTQIIGPFNENQTAEDIHLDVDLNTISGIVLNCQGGTIDNSLAYYYMQQNVVPISVAEDGTYSYLAPGIDHTMKFVDIDNEKVGSLNIYKDQQDQNLELDNIYVCNIESITKISGYVSVDTDKDNVGDTPLEGATINVLKQGTFARVTTDINGYYEVGLTPDTEFDILYSLSGYLTFAAGDRSPEGNQEDEEYAIGKIRIQSNVPEGDHDNNNDFTLTQFCFDGIVTGSVLGDTNDDGIGDLPLEWLSIGPSNGNVGYVESIVASDGTFSFSPLSGYHEIYPIMPFGSNDFLVDWDTSPDPDGDDSHEGSNGKIPVVVHCDEVDSDNNFVINFQDKGVIVCRVLEDTDMDGNGDLALENITLSFSKMVTGGIITKQRSTNGLGIAIFDDYVEEDTKEYTVELVNEGYEIIELIETTPDNNPFIVDGDMSKMVINLSNEEWDAGNVFVVRKK